jgi:hypothetical protein
MATILENVTAKKAVFLSSPVAAGQNMAMAIAAIRDGIKSPAWEFYMTQFARDEKGVLNKEQLARLMGTDNTLGDPTMDRQRAYLVSNAVCGMTTTGVFDRGILSVDNGLGTAACVFQGPAGEVTNLAAQGKKANGPNKAAKKSAKKR